MQPTKRLWRKQRPQSKTTTCTITNLWSLFFYYTTHWRQLWWQDPLALSSPHRWTHIWIDPPGFCFRVFDKIWSFHPFCLPKRTRMLDSLSFHTLGCWKFGSYFVHSGSVEAFFCKFGCSVSRLLKLRLFDETVPWRKLLCNLRIIYFVNETVKIDICSPIRKKMLSLFMLS